jgi:hypothetical protein
MRTLFVRGAPPNCDLLLSRIWITSPDREADAKARCVIIGEPPFRMNSSTTKARRSPDEAMVWTEDDMNTAV